MASFVVDPNTGGASQVIANQARLNEPPTMYGLLLNFSANGNTQSLNTLSLQQTGKLSLIQTIYVDNSQNDNSMIVSIQGSQQIITVRGRTQGYYTVLFPQGANRIDFSGIGLTLVNVMLINVAIPGSVWPTI